MDYRIQIRTENYIKELRALFVDEFKIIPKDVRQELNQYIEMLHEKTTIFIKEYLKLMDQEDEKVRNKYLI
jgi:hypothetical protein